jgi:trimethylamine--corrinoid protein Co-methyltransferase
MTGSLELVALCDEIVGWLRSYFHKLEISEETLALDLIHEVGPDGHFIDTAHTLRHVRDDWRPTLLDRFSYHRWAELGSTTLEQRAKAKVQEIITSHRVEPLATEVQAALQAVINR